MARGEVTAAAEPAAARPAATRSRTVVAVALFLALAALPLTVGVLPSYPYVIQLTGLVLMWVALASSWNLSCGFSGYTSLGHNVFLALGAYTSGVLLVRQGLSPYATALLSGVVCLVVGVVVGLITLRNAGPSFMIATVALMLVVRTLFDNWSWIGGTNGLSLPLVRTSNPDLLKVPFYYAMLGCATVVVAVCYRIQRSKFGLGLRAIAMDEARAAVAGIDPRRYKIAAFALSGFFVGVVGSFWGYSLSYLRPEIFLTLAVAADMALMVILGGRATVAGPVIGAVFLVLFNELSVARFGGTELNLAVTGVLMVATLLFFPAGVVGTLRERRRLPAFLDWDR